MTEDDDNYKDEYNPLKHGITEGSKVISEFLKSKYSHDKNGLYVHLGIVSVILAGIVVLAIFCKLDSSIVGTLLGSLIGFSFGNFPKSGKGNNGN